MMERRDLRDWIKHPEYLNADTLNELKGLLERYPYFQALRMLYLKNLYVLHHPEFRDELYQNAFYIADLSLLFYYIEGSSFKREKVFKKSGGAEKEKTDRTLDLIDEFLAKLPDDSPKGMPVLPIEASTDYTEHLLNLSDEVRADEEYKPLKGQELIDDFIEKSSGFGQNAELSVENDENDAGEETEETLDLTGDTDENYFTETLAQIYIRQKRYEKALEIIKKLNLKYPKKNAYFADQIRFLEKLIINAKTK